MTNKEIVERLERLEERSERLERQNDVLRTYFSGTGACFCWANKELHELHGHNPRPEEVPA